MNGEPKQGFYVPIEEPPEPRQRKKGFGFVEPNEELPEPGQPTFPEPGQPTFPEPHEVPEITQEFPKPRED